MPIDSSARDLTATSDAIFSLSPSLYSPLPFFIFSRCLRQRPSSARVYTASHPYYGSMQSRLPNGNRMDAQTPLSNPLPICVALL